MDRGGEQQPGGGGGRFAGLEGREGRERRWAYQVDLQALVKALASL